MPRIDFRTPGSVEEQKEVLSRYINNYRRVFPEYSRTARKRMLDVLREKKPGDLLTKTMMVETPEETDKRNGEPYELGDGIKIEEVENSEGTGVQERIILPEDVTPLIPVSTPMVDPRTKPFYGNVEMLTYFLGHWLGEATLNEFEKRKAGGKKERLDIGDVLVWGSTPSSAPAVLNGMQLTADRPMLRAAAVVLFREA